MKKQIAVIDCPGVPNCTRKQGTVDTELVFYRSSQITPQHFLGVELYDVVWCGAKSEELDAYLRSRIRRPQP